MAGSECPYCAEEAEMEKRSRTEAAAHAHSWSPVQWRQGPGWTHVERLMCFDCGAWRAVTFHGPEEPFVHER